MPLSVPKYHELPVIKDAPPGSSWGVFDKKDGSRDVFGTLNFITPEAVIAAKNEIKTGESVALNLPLHLPYEKATGRISLSHKFKPSLRGMLVCDDEVTMNTQSSSQWDGLLHFAHQTRGEFYNGVKYSAAAEERTDFSLGIHAISDRGGIVGRGILLDFVDYAAKRGLEYNPLTNYHITLSQIKEMIADEHLTIQQGDILLVRSGVSKWIRNSTPGSVGPWTGRKHIGVEPSDELLEWVWNNNFGAVGGDGVAFESVPGPDGTFGKFHQAALPGWGMPIGELLDLERLAEVAKKEQRWSFFVTVCPVNLMGGAATLANTLAIF